MALTTPVTKDARSARQAWITRPMLITFALLLSFPAWADAVGVYPYLGIEIAIWMIYALGFNLCFGYAGLPSFGHGAFFGIGAYFYGLFYLNAWDSTLLSLLCGALAGGLAASLVGALVARRRGIYFALLTIACGQVFWFLAMKAHSITGGEDGLLNIRRGTLELGVPLLGLKNNVALYYFVMAIFVVCVVFAWRLVHSPFGRVLQALRMNETRARFIGYDVWRTKWLVFTLSGAFAGLSGGLLALLQESAYPDVMNVHGSGFIVMATLIGGGMVSFWGPIIGALVFIAARDLLGALTETWLLWYGLLFMVVVLFQPEGIAGAWQRHTPALLRWLRAYGPKRSPRALTGG